MSIIGKKMVMKWILQSGKPELWDFTGFIFCKKRWDQGKRSYCYTGMRKNT